VPFPAAVVPTITTTVPTRSDVSEDTKRFIDRHMTPGEKRPPAPSVRHDSEARHALRAGGRKTGA